MQLPGDIIDEEGANRAAIVGSRDGSEILLAGCVPDLQLDIFIIDGDGLRSELNPDGHIVSGASFILDVLQHDA